MATTPSAPKLHALVTRLGRVNAIDGVAGPIAKTVRKVIPQGTVKDVLSGVPLGHALHPVLVQVVIGSWTSATLLDLLGGRAAQPAAQRLIAVGIVASPPTTASGLNDWVDSESADDEVRRVGVAHAALNGAALALYAGSLLARRRGRHPRGVALGLAGATALTASGYLGGHLSYAKAVGVDQTAFGTEIPEWTDAGAEADVPADGMLGADVDGATVLLTRAGGQLRALADRCAHRGGPLHEGQLVDGCVECPLHGSRFRLDDGSVMRGPSAYPQPVYEVRVRDGRVEVRSSA